MRKTLFFVTVMALLVAACGPSRERQVERIEEMEDSLFENMSVMDTATAEEMTALYVNFADKYPADSLTPGYLMKAADIQGNALHTERAVAIYDRIINTYPDYFDIPMCYMLKGWAYEQNGNYEEAVAAYSEYVDKFPDHFMAKSVRTMLPNVGMSPKEELDCVMADTNDTLVKSKE